MEHFGRAPRVPRYRDPRCFSRSDFASFHEFYGADTRGYRPARVFIKPGIRSRLPWILTDSFLFFFFLSARVIPFVSRFSSFERILPTNLNIGRCKPSIVPVTFIVFECINTCFIYFVYPMLTMKKLWRYFFFKLTMKSNLKNWLKILRNALFWNLYS